MNRLERLLKLRDRLEEAFDDAWLCGDAAAMDRAHDRMRLVSAAITRAVVPA